MYVQMFNKLRTESFSALLYIVMFVFCTFYINLGVIDIFHDCLKTIFHFPSQSFYLVRHIWDFCIVTRSVNPDVLSPAESSFVIFYFSPLIIIANNSKDIASTIEQQNNLQFKRPIPIYIRGAFNKFPHFFFLYRHLKLS